MIRSDSIPFFPNGDENGRTYSNLIPATTYTRALVEAALKNELRLVQAGVKRTH
ncbi:MAG: hypothetical protein GY759_18125 [Chloroflexi bacterium]|nr:hypothetical protein [Chloroflexota bacterium]